MSGDLSGKEKALHLDWGGKLHDVCDWFILGPSLSFPVCSVSYTHPKFGLHHKWTKLALWRHHSHHKWTKIPWLSLWIHCHWRDSGHCFQNHLTVMSWLWTRLLLPPLLSPEGVLQTLGFLALFLFWSLYWEHLIADFMHPCFSCIGVYKSIQPQSWEMFFV